MNLMMSFVEWNQGLGLHFAMYYIFCIIKKDLIILASILPLSRLFPIYKTMLFYTLFSFWSSMVSFPQILMIIYFIIIVITQLLAQAELVAANEERIQSSRGSRSQQQITSSLLSSALATAGISQASSSRSNEGLY